MPYVDITTRILFLSKIGCIPLLPPSLGSVVSCVHTLSSTGMTAATRNVSFDAILQVVAIVKASEIDTSAELGEDSGPKFGEGVRVAGEEIEEPAEEGGDGFSGCAEGVDCLSTKFEGVLGGLGEFVEKGELFVGRLLF